MMKLNLEAVEMHKAEGQARKEVNRYSLTLPQIELQLTDSYLISYYL